MFFEYFCILCVTWAEKLTLFHYLGVLGVYYSAESCQLPDTVMESFAKDAAHQTCPDVLTDPHMLSVEWS